MVAGSLATWRASADIKVEGLLRRKMEEPVFHEHMTRRAVMTGAAGLASWAAGHSQEG
jgi:hypothetical protein